MSDLTLHPVDATPAGPPQLTQVATAEVLRRLELTVTRRLDGMLQGDHRGLVPGHGTELGEAREYQPGDDVRRIDWNVTARTNTPHVRETIADRELETWLLIDTSASLAFGTATCEKRDLAVAGAAAVAFLADRTGNRLGAVLARPDGAQTVPARTGRPHLQAVLARAVDAARTTSSGEVDLGAALHRLGGTMRRRGLAVVVSDFLAPTGWQDPLRALAVRHEVLCIEVLDPRELALPDVGVLELLDPETGRVREVSTGDRRVREAFAAAAAAQRETTARALRDAGADHLVLRTDRDWLLDVVRFVAGRRDRVSAMVRSRR